MNHLRRTLCAACFVLSCHGLCITSSIAAAPVIDGSEHLDSFDSPVIVNPSPSNTQYGVGQDIEKPLAHEDLSELHDTSNAVSLLNRLQALQQDLQELRGQVEVQANNLYALQQQQLEFYKEKAVDTPLKKPTSILTSPNNNQAMHSTLSPRDTLPPETPQVTLSATVPEPNTNAVPTQALPSRATEQLSYLDAYELINNKQFDAALPAMQAFITQYPQGEYTANAYYWIGELFMVQKNYPKAIEHFELVLKQFPASSKSSASMLKIGYALAAAGKLGEAQQHLQAVIQHYPDTHAAHLAMAKLESIGSR